MHTHRFQYTIMTTLNFSKYNIVCCSNYKIHVVQYIKISDTKQDTYIFAFNMICIAYHIIMTTLATSASILIMIIVFLEFWVQGFTMLMDGSRIDDLQRMYLLFSRVNALESLRQALSSYTRRTGQGMVMDEEKDKDMVSCLLEFKASLDKIWEESFSKNEAFCNTIKDAFEHLINLRQVSSSRLIIYLSIVKLFYSLLSSPDLNFSSLLRML